MSYIPVTMYGKQTCAEIAWEQAKERLSMKPTTRENKISTTLAEIAEEQGSVMCQYQFLIRSIREGFPDEYLIDLIGKMLERQDDRLRWMIRMMDRQDDKFRELFNTFVIKDTLSNNT